MSRYHKHDSEVKQIRRYVFNHRCFSAWQKKEIVSDSIVKKY